MGRKHKAAKIAQQRVEYLYKLAQDWTAQDRIEDAQNAIAHLRKLASSHVLSISEISKTICKDCNAVMIEGKTCTTRIHNNRRVRTCSVCSHIRRFPYS